MDSVLQDCVELVGRIKLGLKSCYFSFGKILLRFQEINLNFLMCGGGWRVLVSGCPGRVGGGGNT